MSDIDDGLPDFSVQFFARHNQIGMIPDNPHAMPITDFYDLI
jgi:hypothetical protein